MELNQQRFHPLLATPDEAHGALKDHIFSDHLPIMIALPVYGNAQQLDVISWNVFDEMRPYGFKSPGQDDTADTLPDAVKRAERITQVLERWLTEQTNPQICHADVVLLQEVGMPLSIALHRLVAEHPEIEICQGEHGNTTLFNKNKLTLDDGYPQQTVMLESALLTRFQLNDHPEIHIAIHNVHLAYRDLSEESEQKIRYVMHEELLLHNNNCLIMGDFNCRIVPVDTHQNTQLLVTAVCPSSYRQASDGSEQGQGVDWVDGAFCFGEDGEIIQLPFNILDPQSGIVFNTEMSQEQTEMYVRQLNAFQRDEIEGLRATLCCADNQLNTPAFSGGQSFLKFQELLRRYTGDETLLVRPAANALNARGMSIASTHKAFMAAVYLNLSGVAVEKKRYDLEVLPVTVLSVPEQDIPALECAAYSALKLDREKMCVALESHISDKFINLRPADDHKIAKTLRQIVKDEDTDNLKFAIIMLAILRTDNSSFSQSLCQSFGMSHDDLYRAYQQRFTGLMPDYLLELDMIIAQLAAAIKDGTVKLIKEIDAQFQHFKRLQQRSQTQL